MQHELRTGYIVHLNSGSPDLKVVGTEGDQIEVEWVNEGGNLERMKMPETCFVLK